MKISIVGIGRLGSLIAFYLTSKNICSELSLIDRDTERVKTKATYLSHVSSLLGKTRIYQGGFETTADADVIILATNISRDKLTSIQETRQIINNIAEFNNQAIILVVSLPMDQVTYTAYKTSGFPVERVFGVGTYIDSMRIQSLLAKGLNYNPSDLEVMVIGEHGEHMVPIFSCATVHGVPLSNIANIEPEKLSKIMAEARQQAIDIIPKCHDTFGPAAVTVEIVESIIYDSKKIIPVSFYQTGAYGVEGITVSLPAIIGKNGIEDILQLTLTEEEQNTLNLGAQILKTEMQTIEKELQLT